ncbi:MAG: type VI secretion protein [Burkholderiales bacterium PBB4]|nr:MAG: type VI secretion protein [Burkholderiales bacterium PBB4]
MELNTRNVAVAELKTQNQRLLIGLVATAIAVLGLTYKLIAQSEIVIVQTPGMPANSIIERESFDKWAQMATLNAITANLGQINPSNAEYQKKFLQLYFSPTAYTRLNAEIDLRVEKMRVERELGSSYFVFKRYEYDGELNNHFVIGEQHTVNAATDTTEDYVFEYSVHIENYRLWVDEVKTYKGDKAHNSEWMKANKK